MKLLLRAVLAGVLGASTALLVACGHSNVGKIPATIAGQLDGDFDAVAQAVLSHNCAAAAQAASRAQSDVANLPSSVDGRLKANLEQGVTTLAASASQQCTQTTTSATGPTGPTSTTTGPTSTNTTPTGTSGPTSTTTGPTSTNTTPTGSSGPTSTSTGPTSQTTTGGGGGGTTAPAAGGGGQGNGGGAAGGGAP